MITKLRTIDGCRICGEPNLQAIREFGDMPLADGLRLAPSTSDEDRFPLTVSFCRNCSLVQTLENVDPRILFGGDYPYFASCSTTWVEHNRKHVEELIESRYLNSNSLVCEIASNDGYLLQHFLPRDIPVLGIDPAPEPVAAAREKGIPVREEFFRSALVDELVPIHGHADVIIGNNVLAHVQDLNDLIDGVARLLKPDGAGVFEFPYLGDLIEHCEFDTIYHEHHCYFSLTAIDRLAQQHGLYLNDVRPLATHGGSVRVSLEKIDRRKSCVDQLLAKERDNGLTEFSFFESFSDRIESIGSRLRDLLTEIRRDNKTVVGYAAAAKGAMLLNGTGIAKHLDYVVDRNEFKQGRFMPGTNLEIYPPEKILQDQPDYLLLLAWNLKDEIIQQQGEYSARGGKFIVPIPDPVVVQSAQ